MKDVYGWEGGGREWATKSELDALRWTWREGTIQGRSSYPLGRSDACGEGPSVAARGRRYKNAASSVACVQLCGGDETGHLARHN
jgi:hypothetical protein